MLQRIIFSNVHLKGKVFSWHRKNTVDEQKGSEEFTREITRVDTHEFYFFPPVCFVCLFRGGVSGRPASIPP